MVQTLLDEYVVFCPTRTKNLERYLLTVERSFFVVQVYSTRTFEPKPWIRKVRTSRGHLLVEKRTMLET
jgi:hypothetical protein